MQPYQMLEQELASWLDIDPELMVVCSSGTAALHLAYETLQLPEGSTVLLPDFTMVACPRAVSLAGLSCTFVDCGGNNLLIDPRLLTLDILGGKTGRYVSSIMAVHVYGRRVDMEAVHSLSELAGGIPIVEDLAEAHGVSPHKATAAFCYSFFLNKIIAGEEGGAVGFRDERLAARARQLRSLGFTDDHDFVHVPRGCNYRLSNANASLILENFKVPQWIRESPELRQDPRWLNNVVIRRIAERCYDELCPDEWRMPPRDAPWVYDIRVPGMMPLRQAELVRALQAEGIAARHAFKPCSSQEEYRHCPVYGNGNAAVASREVIYLPLDPRKVTKESCRKAFEVIRKVVGDWTTMK